MAKKMAVVAIELDDDEDNFETTSDLALYVQILLEKRSRGVDVTVYATPEDLMADTQEGHSMFSEDRQDRPEILKRIQDVLPSPAK